MFNLSFFEEWSKELCNFKREGVSKRGSLPRSISIVRDGSFAISGTLRNVFTGPWVRF